MLPFHNFYFMNWVHFSIMDVGYSWVMDDHWKYFHYPDFPNISDMLLQHQQWSSSSLLLHPLRAIRSRFFKHSRCRTAAKFSSFSFSDLMIINHQVDFSINSSFSSTSSEFVMEQAASMMLWWYRFLCVLNLFFNLQEIICRIQVWVFVVKKMNRTWRVEAEEKKNMDSFRCKRILLN